MPWNMRCISGEDRNRGEEAQAPYNDRGSRIDEVVVDCDTSNVGPLYPARRDVAARVYPTFEHLKERRPATTLSVGGDTLRYELWHAAAVTTQPGPIGLSTVST